MIRSIFISSSGDLSEFRRKLADELETWLSRHGFIELVKPYLWEEDKEGGKLLSDRQRIQNQLPDPASPEVPLTICVFGERCGSPLEDEPDPRYAARFDAWRAKGEGPGLLHPWPRDPEAQRRALACGQYPLTGTVFELISAHAASEEMDNLILAYCSDHPITENTRPDAIVLNGKKLYARLTAGRPARDVAATEAEIYDPQCAALLNLLKDHARRVRFVPHYPSEDAMREAVLEIAKTRLRRILGIASLRNPFKESLAHWTIDDEKPLPGRGGDVARIVKAMKSSGERLILLQGRSGCGKSSLMQRGVMARLREDDGSIPVAFRPTELMAASGEGDALDRLVRLITETAGLPTPRPGPKAMRPITYAKGLDEALREKRIQLVLGLDQFEEVIDELALEKACSEGPPQTGWWLVVRFLKALGASKQVRLIATLESAREESFNALRLGEETGLTPETFNVDATDETVAAIARAGFSNGGLPLDDAVIEAIKRRWRAFEKDTAKSDASPLPLACLFLQRLYEKFADQAGSTAGERMMGAFDSAATDRLLSLEEIGGEGAIAFADIIQTLADEAWLAGFGRPDFADPIETDQAFGFLDNFLAPLVTVSNDGQMQLRAPVEADADAPTRRLRKAFSDRRLLTPLRSDGERRVRPVHQALIDRWSPALRWLSYRSHLLKIVNQFCEDAKYWARHGKAMPIESDGTTLHAAALTLLEHGAQWQLRREAAFPSDEAALRDAALAVLDTATEPLALVEGSRTKNTLAHVAALYHRVHLLKQFVASHPECVHVETTKGETPLLKAAWSDGPAVQFLLDHGAALTTEKSPWNAIAAPISQKLKENFDTLVCHVGIDDVVHSDSQCRMVHLAAQFGNLHAIDYLISKGATLDIKDNIEWTALHFAASSDLADAFLQLLPHIDIKEPDKWKRTAISIAAGNDSHHVIAAYLGAEDDLARLHWVLKHCDRVGDTPLMYAARWRKPRAIRALLQTQLGDMGDPRASAHIAENGDTLLHLAFRGQLTKGVEEAERLAAKDVVEIVLRDGRLDPTKKNAAGETAFDIATGFPEARRVLRRDDRVPKDYASMTPSMVIDDLSSRNPATVLRLLKDAPQALNDTHERSGAGRASETGLAILLRLKNHAVLATLVGDDAQWPNLQRELPGLATLAATPSAAGLRGALLRRALDDDPATNAASALFGAAVEADDADTARALLAHGVTPTLRSGALGKTVLHRAAIAGDAERFRAVCALARFVLPLDAWGRRPSDLAAEPMADAFRALEAEMGDPTAAPVEAVPAGAEKVPLLSLERRGEACAVGKDEMAVLRRAWRPEWGDIDTQEVSVFENPFYPDVPLIDVTPRAGALTTGRRCFLLHQNDVFSLNGTSPPIHEVNAKFKPVIDEKLVMRYLAFFCFFIRGEEGPFLIVDRPANGFLPDFGERAAEFRGAFRPPKLWGREDDGSLRVSALVYYSNVLFWSDFAVEPSGMIKMLDDIPVLADFSVRVDAPLELRTLH